MPLKRLKANVVSVSQSIRGVGWLRRGHVTFAYRRKTYCISSDVPWVPKPQWLSEKKSLYIDTYWQILKMNSVKKNKHSSKCF